MGNYHRSMYFNGMNIPPTGDAPSPTPPTPPVPIRIPLTEVPVGYDLRGKKVVFERTDLKPGGMDFETPPVSFMASNFEVPLQFHVDFLGDTPGATGNIYSMSTIPDTMDEADRHIYDVAEWDDSEGNTHPAGWNKTTFQMPDEHELLVSSNNLPASTDPTKWGFQHAYVIE